MEDTKMKHIDSFDFDAPENVPKRGNQFYAAIAAGLGAFGLGTVLGWSSPADPVLDEWGLSGAKAWVGSVATLGGAASVIPAGIAMDAFGRRVTMLALAVPFVAGWLLLAFTRAVWALIVARVVIGAAGGAYSVLVPAYVGEVADTGVRGALGAIFQLLLVSGIEFVYVLRAAQLSLRALTLCCAATPVAFAILFFRAPESPAYLTGKGDAPGARRALRWLRGDAYDVEPEIQALQAMAQKAAEGAQQAQGGALKALSGPAARKGLLVAVGLMVFLQISGVNVVIFYAEPIFENAGGGLEGQWSALVLGAVQVLATLGSALVVERLGRRPLLLVSAAVMAASCFALGTYLQLQENGRDDLIETLGWLPLTSLCLFVVAFSIGFGPVPWMMVGEIFAPETKGIATSIACVFNWLLAFLVTRFFSDLQRALGQGYAFFVFGGASVVGVIFVLTLVPETKGKELVEILRELGGRQTPSDSRRRSSQESHNRY